MFAYRHDILKAMISDGARLVVLGRLGRLSDLPEFKDSPSENKEAPYTPQRKVIVVAEPYVLNQVNDPFRDNSMVIYFFAKALHQIAGLRPVDPAFEQRRPRDRQQYELRVKRLDVEFDHKLQKLYDDAMAKGLWNNTPAARDRVEYWAAGVVAYFDAGGPQRPAKTREELQAYDPALFGFVEETMAYKDREDWRYKP
jgi:hypothetical protein